MNNIITCHNDEIGALGCAQTPLTDIKSENAHDNPLDVSKEETRASLARCACVVNQNEALVSRITAAAVRYSGTGHPVRRYRAAIQWIVGIELGEDARSFIVLTIVLPRHRKSDGDSQAAGTRSRQLDLTSVGAS